METIKYINIDFSKKCYDKIIAKANDVKARFIQFRMCDNQKTIDLTGIIPRVYFLKQDGTEGFNDLFINDSKGGLAILELTEQMLAVPGELKMELNLFKDNARLSNIQFEVNVISSLTNAFSIISTNEWQSLIDGLSSLSEYDSYKNEIKDARKGKQTLKEKIDSMDSSIANIVNNHLSISVKDFGAKGDGTTNDTEAFQKAVDYITSNGSNKLIVPCGKYIVDTITINKLNAKKIIIEGQVQKPDYWNELNETTQIIIRGEKGLDVTGVSINIIGISFMGYNRKNTGIAINNGKIALFNCKLYKFNIGLDIKSGMHLLDKCEVTDNNVGVSLYKSGDSLITDCYINTNTVGVSYSQYCANSQIRGGKIEWNEKGILCLSGGLLIQGIQFDFNKFYDIWIEGGVFEGHPFAIHPDNVFNISIIGNRFLGSGYITNNIESSGACNIWLYKCSEILINGNTFATSGRHAFENSGLSPSEPDYKVGPITSFIKIRNSIASINDNAFNTQYNVPPVMVVDTVKVVSKIQYTGNIHSVNKIPFIYDFGSGDIEGSYGRIYSSIGGINISRCSKKPTFGTFNVGDTVLNVPINGVQKWVCTEAGTIRVKPQVNIVSTAGNDYFEVVGEIDESILHIGDYVKIQYEAKKVIRIVYNDGNLVLDSPRIFVEGIIETTYNGAFDYYLPTFTEYN